MRDKKNQDYRIKIRYNQSEVLRVSLARPHSWTVPPESFIIDSEPLAVITTDFDHVVIGKIHIDNPTDSGTINQHNNYVLC